MVLATNVTDSYSMTPETFGSPILSAPKLESQIQSNPTVAPAKSWSVVALVEALKKDAVNIYKGNEVQSAILTDNVFLDKGSSLFNNQGILPKKTETLANTAKNDNLYYWVGGAVGFLFFAFILFKISRR